MATNARILDRRRFQVLVGEGDATEDREAVLAGLDAYRNADGGYGWGLEPDLRATESQPGAALHAFEAMADVAPTTTPNAAALCDWLHSVTLPDGGLPFAFPIRIADGCAPFWAAADPTASSLQITAAVAAHTHRVARFDPAVANHPWLAVVTQYCVDSIRAVDDAPFAYVLSFALQFLDAAGDSVSEGRGTARAPRPVRTRLRCGPRRRRRRRRNASSTRLRALSESAGTGAVHRVCRRRRSRPSRQ